MNTDSTGSLPLQGGIRPWWKLRRVRWLLAAVVLVSGALFDAVISSGVSRIVVYNELGVALPELSISACGQTKVFHDLGDRESVRVKLASMGAASDIVVATNGATLWQGEYIEPRGGYRAILRLRRDGQVECSTTISWLQTFFAESGSKAP